MATEYKLSYTASEIDEKLGKIDDLATKSEVPTKTSDLTNDSGFLTSYAEIDPTVPAWAKASTKPSYTASEVGADVSGTASNLVSVHNTTSNTHSDIREQISQLSTDKADKSAMTLGVHTDGLVYLFINGAPQGNGLDIKADVIEGDVFGYVDENNVIVLNGSIPEGTYTVKYEMKDGSTVDIGDLVLDNTVYYSVTNSLTNCVSSNSDTQADEGGSYSATISANSGYKLSSVVVTMGGTDISASAVSGGTITIANVTGNIVITAVATEVVSEPSYTNLLPLSVDADGNDFVGVHENGGDGYEYGYKVSASSGNLKSSDAYVSGFIPLADINDVVRIANIELSGSAAINNIVFYDASKTLVYGTTGTEGAFTKLVKVEDGYIWFFAKSWTSSDIAFFRFSCGGITDETIVTVNEEIV